MWPLNVIGVLVGGTVIIGGVRNFIAQKTIVYVQIILASISFIKTGRTGRVYDLNPYETTNEVSKKRGQNEIRLFRTNLLLF